MEVQLKSISPLSYMMVKEGERVTIQYRPPRPNEYREKIGPASECYLVFKGETKIGMIPKEIIISHKNLLKKRNCRVAKIDKSKSILTILLSEN